MPNFSYFLTRTARRYGTKPAVFYRKVYDYRYLNQRVSQLASIFMHLGLKRGDRVGIVCDCEPRGLESLFGPLRAGMVIVPMNPRLHPAEHAYMLLNCDARALICGRPYLDGLMAVRSKLPTNIRIIGFDSLGYGDSSVIDYDEALKEGDPTFGDVEISEDDLAWIFYTSGTTGYPKGAMLTYRNLLTMVTTQLIECNPITAEDRFAYMAPLSHSSGLATFQLVARGAGHVFPDFKGFRPERFYQLVEHHRVTVTYMVPTMIQMLLDDPSHKKYDLSSLQTIMYGGSPMYLERLKEAVATFGPIFVQGYAQGEAPRAITYLPKEDHVPHDTDGERRLASCGRECLHVEIRIVDDKDRPLPPRTQGEVVVRGNLVMLGYWNNPEATKQALRNGWLHTGDIGYLDEGGYLFLTDRKKDMIITGGSNVYPREIEEVLYRHPAVQEACVFGVPDPKWIERIVAVVVLKDSVRIEASELIQWCRDYVGSFKKPSEVHFVDALPKSGYGKVLKRELRRKLYPE